jgi:hypothetical protein
MADVEKKIKETISNGGVLALLYFDVHAKDKDSAQQLGVGFVNHILEKEGVVMAMGEIDEPIEPEEEGKNVSASIEVKVLTRDFATLANLCMENSPFTVEILRPDKIVLPLDSAHTLLGNISATSAEYKRHIITKVSSKEEVVEFQRQMQKRAELGKKLMEKKGEK